MPGVPVSHRIVLKPNATGVYAKRVEDVWGVGTDPSFYEGVITGLQELGVKKLTMIDSTPYDTWVIRGMIDVNARLGVEWNESRNRERHLRDEFNINWHEVPDGVVFTRIPHYAPVGEPDTWLLNIAKWKSHSHGADADHQERAGPGRPPVRGASAAAGAASRATS